MFPASMSDNWWRIIHNWNLYWCRFVYQFDTLSVSNIKTYTTRPYPLSNLYFSEVTIYVQHRTTSLPRFFGFPSTEAHPFGVRYRGGSWRRWINWQQLAGKWTMNEDKGIFLLNMWLFLSMPPPKKAHWLILFFFVWIRDESLIILSVIWGL